MSRASRTLPRLAPGADIPALTGLRIVAAGWVLAVHYYGYLTPLLVQAAFLQPILGSGWVGVELFFILSGFLLTRGYLDSVGSRPGPRAIGVFLVKRFARVWPAWAVVTVLMAGWLLASHWRGIDTEIYTQHPAVTPWALVRQLTMTQMWGRHTLGGAFDPPGWSISAEWAAYLAFPLLALVLRPLRRLGFWANLALAYAAVLPLAYQAYEFGLGPGQQNWFPRIVCGFLAGMFVALALHRVPRTPRTDTLGLVLAGGSIFLLVMCCYWATWRQGGDAGHNYAHVTVLAFPGLVAGLALTTRGPARLLASAPLVYGGRISYCVYLTHFAMLDVVVSLLGRNSAQPGVATPRLTFLVPFLILAVLGASALLYHGVEEPARRLLLGLLNRRKDADAAGRDTGSGEEPLTAFPGAPEPTSRPQGTAPADRRSPPLHSRSALTMPLYGTDAEEPAIPPYTSPGVRPPSTGATAGHGHR